MTSRRTGDNRGVVLQLEGGGVVVEVVLMLRGMTTRIQNGPMEEVKKTTLYNRFCRMSETETRYQREIHGRIYHQRQGGWE